LEEFARFLAVADTGNMSRAARSLNISQPALSRSIALLEERYRTALFHRGAGGMRLTEAGRILYDHASRALRMLRTAEERIDYEGGGGHLSLNVCAGDSWGNALLPSILERFMRAHPEIRVRLDIVGSETRMAGLAAGDYELSYGIGLPRHERLGKVAFEPMLQAGYAVYCSADHPLRGQSAPLTEEDLTPFLWIKHKFEFDHDPVQWQVTGRTYAMSTNTMLSTLELVRQTRYLLSAQHVSGLHVLRDAILSPPARQFAAFCRSACRSLPGAYQGRS
jgi:DNA-binding transcriptional LysR family regulator